MAMAALAAAALLPAAALAAKVALLVGAGEVPGQELDGPAHDVQALREVLVGRLGYAPDAVHALGDHVKGHEATREAILRELKQLMPRTREGDEVLVYFSGHGTSALDARLGLPVPDGSGAFVPVDVDMRAGRSPAQILSSLIVGRTDLRPVFEALDKAGRKVWFISDSCYSGQQVRALSAGVALRSRMLPMLVGGDAAAFEAARERSRKTAGQQDWPYRDVVFLSAAAEGETAKDIGDEAALKIFPTVDGKPHGAMTDALLRVLKGDLPADADGDGRLSLQEIHAAVGHFMSQRAYGHTPQRLPSVLDDKNAAGARSLMSAGAGTGTGNGSTQAGPPPRIALDTALPDELRRRVRAISGIAVVSPDQPALLRVLKSGKDVLVKSGGGDPIARAPADNPAQVMGILLQQVWAHRLEDLALRGRRGVLPAEIEPARLGGNFLVGDTLYFVARPDRNAYVLLLNVDSLGKASVLYPWDKRELAAIKAGTARAIPGDSPQDRINAKEPLGMDVQLIFAFDEQPAGLPKLVGQADIAPDDPRLAALEDMVRSAQGRFTFNRTELRVSAKR